MDLTMSPQSSMKIASVVDRAVRAVASKALLNVNTPFNLSEEVISSITFDTFII